MNVRVGEHTVEYRADGRLVALDHGDVEAEQALAALSGRPACACIDLVLAWQDAIGDPRTPLVAPRSAEDAVHLDPDELETLAHQVAAWRERMRGAGRLDPTVADFEKRLLDRLRWLRLWTLPVELQLALREHAVGSGG